MSNGYGVGQASPLAAGWFVRVRPWYGLAGRAGYLSWRLSMAFPVEVVVESMLAAAERQQGDVALKVLKPVEKLPLINLAY